MPEDKLELSSAELIRQAREALAPPKAETWVSTRVDGPTIKELLAEPLSSESLLPQRAVDHWASSEESHEAPWEQIGHAVESASPGVNNKVRKRPYVPAANQPPPALAQPPPPQWVPEPPSPPLLEPIRDDLGLPPAPSRLTRAPQPSGPPVAPRRKANVPWRLIVFGFIAFSVLIGNLADDSTTSTTQLELGGCYDSANLADADRVNCAQPHRVQVFALLTMDQNAGGAANRCFDEATILRDTGSIPASAIVPDGTFVGATTAPSTSAGNTFCYFESPVGGLIGSVLPE